VDKKYLQWLELAFSHQLVRLFLVLLAALLVHFIVKRVLVRAVRDFSARTQNKLDDLFSQYKVFDLLAFLGPILVLRFGAALVPQMAPVLGKLVSVLWALFIALLVDRLLSVGLSVYERYPISRRWPLKGYVQVVKLIVYCAAVIVALCALLEKSPWGFLSGLGALSAILMLVFRTTILSFVASFQVISQGLIRVGDWIEMPKYGVDGEVVDVTLTNLIVQNWDKTLVTVPTYKLLEDSFKNWRGMEETGGRRIKRAVMVDQATVRFCDEEMIERFKKIHLIKGYVEKKVKEIEEHNRRLGIDPQASPVNGRRMTNLGTFRIYLEEYLRQHPQIRKDMTLMVRQLKPTPEGLPLEVYAFVSDTRWVYYERIQADIFDHILAAAPEFGLKVFQIPSGGDLREGLAALRRTDGGDG